MWEILGFIAAIIAAVAITIGLVSYFIRAGEENSANQANGRIRPRRDALDAPDAPAPIGPTSGKGGAYHYDNRGRLVGWERWQYPAPVQVQNIPAGVPAVVLLNPGQTAQVAVLPTQQQQPVAIVPAHFPPVAQPGQPAVPINPAAAAAAGAAAAGTP